LEFSYSSQLQLEIASWANQSRPLHKTARINTTTHCPGRSSAGRLKRVGYARLACSLPYACRLGERAPVSGQDSVRKPFAAQDLAVFAREPGDSRRVKLDHRVVQPVLPAFDDPAPAFLTCAAFSRPPITLSLFASNEGACRLRRDSWNGHLYCIRARAFNTARIDRSGFVEVCLPADHRCVGVRRSRHQRSIDLGVGAAARRAAVHVVSRNI